jgi:hypothetical protein
VKPNAFDDVIRKTVDVHVRYYSSLGRLALDYWRELFAAVAQPMNQQMNKEIPGAARSAPGQASSAVTPPPPSPGAATMVIEADAGSVGVGVFMIENRLGSDVDSRVAATSFKDPEGEEVQPTFVFDPPRVVLKPGEQILVRVSTTLDPSLECGTRYTGEFVVPGLRGTTIPVVLRSRRKPQLD